jgi:hypothetical protein
MNALLKGQLELFYPIPTAAKLQIKRNLDADLHRFLFLKSAKINVNLRQKKSC